MISIIVPCYNYGLWLPEALNSARSQTCRNWECIIVDDGSTDNTQEVAEGFVNLDSRFRYLRQDNKGLASARNTGLRAIKGKYIQLLDADDLLPADKIEKHVSVLEANPDIDLVYGRVYVFERYTAAIPDAKEIVLQVKQSGTGVKLLEALIEDNIFLVHCALFKASFIRDIGFFDEGMITCEDWNYWFRCALAGKNFLFFDDEKSKVYVRSHGNNMSANRKKMWTGKIYFHTEVANMLNNSDLPDFGPTEMRNKQLMLIQKTRFELAYGNIAVGMTSAMKIVFLFGDFLPTFRDSLYWIRERILKKV